MNILFVDEKSWQKKVPYTIHYLAEQLVLRGHSVHAIDYDDTWSRASVLDWWSRGTQRSIDKLGSGAAVEVTSPGFVKIVGLSRISTIVTHCAALVRLVRERRIDVMVTYGLTNAAPALTVSRMMRIPILFHSIDMLAPLVPHPLLGRPAEMIEAQLIRRCSCVLALTPVFAERARRIGARRTAVIPNGVALARLRPGLNTDSLRRELGLVGKRVLVFVGTFTPLVGLSELLNAFASSDLANTSLVLVGDDIVTQGHERRVAEHAVRKLGIGDRVIFAGLQPASRVPEYINLADICLSPFPPSTFSKYNIAMKVFEYMACGKPTVCFDLEGTKSLVPPNSWGVIYVQSHAEMMQRLRMLLADPAECLRLGREARVKAEEHLSWEKVGARLESVLAHEVQRARSREG